MTDRWKRWPAATRDDAGDTFFFLYLCQEWILRDGSPVLLSFVPFEASVSHETIKFTTPIVVSGREEKR